MGAPSRQIEPMSHSASRVATTRRAGSLPSATLVMPATCAAPSASNSQVTVNGRSRALLCRPRAAARSTAPSPSAPLSSDARTPSEARRRSLITRSVSSLTAQKMPSTRPRSVRSGLYENV